MTSFKKSAIVIGALALLIPAITLAHGVNSITKGKNMGGMAAAGTVTSVNGTTITLTGKNGTIYTVDASKAQVEKVTAGAVGAKPTQTTVTVSAIQNGDTLMVLGTVSGNNVAATKIIDGAFAGAGKGIGFGRGGMTNHGVAGTITAVNGNSLTVTGKNSTIYTVDATNAKITKFTAGVNGAKGTSATITVSGIAVGDNVMVMGTVTGTNVVAKQITDGTFPTNPNMGKRPVSGSVVGVSGNTITLTGRNKTTYTVDATNAKIVKLTAGTGGAKPTQTTIAISAIQTGDNLMVMGTVTGNNVAATNIIDGSFPARNFHAGLKKPAGK